MQRISLLASLCLALPAVASAQITLDDGTIVGVDATTDEIVKFSTTGTILQTLATSFPGAPTGLDVVNGQLFANDTSGQVFSVNISTGALTPIFSPGIGPLENMGSVNGELLITGWNTSQVDHYDTAGTLLSSTTLSQTVGTTGFDSDGTSYFCGEWQSGLIFIFDLSGNLQNTLNVGIAPNSISGLTYDGITNTLWVSLGFGNDTVMNVDLNGNVLATWATNSRWINGIDFIGDGFQLADGSLVGVDATTDEIHRYTPAGVIVETLQTTFPGNPTGLDVVNGQLFANDTTGQIFSVDLGTGNLTPLFSPGAGALENMGSANGELLVSGYSSSQIFRFDTAGTPLGTVNLSQTVSCTGLDSDGTNYYLGEYPTGLIYTFDPSGNLLSTINVGIAGSSISGLTHDASTNTLWVSLGFGNDTMMNIDLAGNVLTTWPTNSPWINGIDFIGTSSGGITVVCDPANNHTGGNYVKLDNSTLGAGGGSGLHIEAIDGPAGEFGYFLISAGLNNGVPVSNGILCLAAPQGRYAPAAGSSLNSVGQFNAAGVYNSTIQAQQGFDVPTTLPNPPGGAIVTGDTWYFQMWYRDGTRSNFSNTICVTF